MDSVKAGVVPVLPEALGKRVMIDLQLRDPKVLVSRHRHEFRLRERKGDALGSHDDGFVGCRRLPIQNRNDVKPRNVTMHGVQDHMTLLILETIRQLEFIERHQAAHPV